MKFLERFSLSTASGADPWRTLEALGVYRISLCLLLLMLSVAPFPPQFIGRASMPLFDTVTMAYLLFAATVMILLRLRTPGVFTQAALHIGGDLVALLCLTHASGGAPSGLGLLMITPVAAAALLFSWRLAIAFAAMSTLGVLALEAYRHVSGSAFPPAYTQAGMLGLIQFVIALSGSALAGRARDSEALVVRFGSDLAKLSRLNETIIQKLDAGVLVVDAQGRVQLQNDAATALLGGGRDRRPVTVREPQLWSLLTEWLETPEKIRNTTLTTSAGKLVWPQFTRLGQGDGAATLVVLEDADRVTESAQRIKLAALGRLTASIAHEIRNPLAAIRQAGQLLAESHAIEPQEKSLLDIVDRQTDRINKIVKDILGLTRSSDDQRQTLELGDFIRRKRQEFLQTVEGEVPRISLAPTESAVLASVDPSHLEQVLFNIWGNACVHARREDAELRIDMSAQVSEDGRSVTIRIVDNGPGIAETVRRQIFEPFFSTRHDGTGLGLYIARELCDANGGGLKVAVSGDGGTTFEVRLRTASTLQEAS